MWLLAGYPYPRPVDGGPGRAPRHRGRPCTGQLLREETRWEQEDVGATAWTPASKLETLVGAACTPWGTRCPWFCKGWRLCRLVAEL